MRPRDGGAKVAHGLGNVHRREPHEAFPGDAWRAAGEEEEAGRPAQLALGMTLGIQRKAPDVIEEVLEVGRNAEVPDGTGDHDAIASLHDLPDVIEFETLSRTCIILELEVGEWHVLQADLLGLRSGHTLEASDEEIREVVRVARVIGAGDEDQDLHLGIIQELLTVYSGSFF